MYQNCTTVQFQLALQYELKVASDHIVNLINDFVNSIPNEVLLDAGDHNKNLDPYPQSWKHNFGGIFMTKISIETKIKAIEEYCTTASSLRGTARKYGIAQLDFQICVGIYARFGKEKLLNPPTATGDFRLNLVKWKQQNLASIPETCIHFGFCSPGFVYRWECQYNKHGAQALLKLRPGRKSKHELIKSRERDSTFKGAESASPKRELILKDSTRCLKKISSLEKASKKELAQVIYDLGPRIKSVQVK